MKINAKTLLLSIFVSVLMFSLDGEGRNEQYIVYKWFEAADVTIRDDEAYIDSNKGLARVTVIEYDSENDRYLIEISDLY